MWKLFGAPTKPEPSQLELELGERVEKMERIVRDMRLDWDDMYEKFRLLYARAAKRIREAAKIDNQDEQEPPQIAPESTIHPTMRRQAPRIQKGNY